MPKNLLFEFGFLGLPRKLFGREIPDFEGFLNDVVRLENFEFKKIRHWISSNRFGILIEGIGDVQKDIEKEIRGPKASAAYDLNNLPTPAAMGFASAQGLELKDLYTKEVDGEKFIFAKRVTKGISIEQSLPKLATTLFSKIPFTNNHWQKKALFPQPPIYFCSKLDDETPELEIDGLKAQSETAVFDGIKFKKKKLEHASDFPILMKKIGLLPNLQERKAILESRIREVLPNGFKVRKNQEIYNRINLLVEDPKPIFIPFDEKYTKISEFVLQKVFINSFDYLVCEDSQGKIQPGVICLPFGKDLTSEKKVRTRILIDYLDKLYKLWNEDSLIDIFALKKNIIEEEFEEDRPENKFKASAICKWLVDYLQVSENLELLNEILSWIRVGEQTSLAKLLPEAGPAIISSLLQEKETDESLLTSFNEINKFLYGKRSLPKTEVGKVICLSSLFEQFVKGNKSEEEASEEIIEFLILTNLRLDVFYCFNKLFPGFKFNRRLWIDRLLKLYVRDRAGSNTGENLFSTQEFDPVSFREVIREWDAELPSEGENLSALFARLKNKLCDINSKLKAEPETDVEKEMNDKLCEIEKLKGVDYLKIYDFFISNRVDIEACLMDLPAVLDDTNSELAPRISLLQRLQSQLGKLAFARKEKKVEKN